MRLFIIGLIAALCFAPVAHAESGAKAVKLTVKGALVSIPNSGTTLELGQDTSVASATQTKGGILTIRLASTSPKSGFVIKGLSLSQFSVMFTAKGASKATDLDPSMIGDHAFTYLPAPGATMGGTFTITLPGQAGTESKIKAFLR